MLTTILTYGMYIAIGLGLLGMLICLVITIVLAIKDDDSYNISSSSNENKDEENIMLDITTFTSVMDTINNHHIND